MRYRIHRMKDSSREQFRWAPHTGGLAIVKPKDYEVSDELQAGSVYAVWKTLDTDGRALRIGDIVETLDGGENLKKLQIFKYIGFESAQWFVPEVRTNSETPELVDNFNDRSFGAESISTKSA